MRLRVIGKTKPKPAPPGQDEGVWVEQALPGGWFARGRMVVQGNRVAIAELRLVSAKAATPPGGVTQAVARSVPYGSFGPFVLATASFTGASGIGGLRAHFEHTVGKLLPRLAADVPRPRRRRARGQDDRFYAVVASDYLTAIAQGSRRPIQDLAEARGVAASRVRDMVHAARERGLLSPSKSGQRGGRLLPRAGELLATPIASPAKKPRRPRR